MSRASRRSPGRPSASCRRTGPACNAGSRGNRRRPRCPRGGQPRRAGCSSAMTPSTRMACSRLGLAQRRSSPGVNRRSRADALDVVVHPDLAVGQELDIDRGRRPVADDGVTRSVVDRRAGRASRGTASRPVADAGDEPERQARASASARPRSAPHRRAAPARPAGTDRGSARRGAASPGGRASQIGHGSSGCARPCARLEEPVVADLDHLARLPERLDRQVAAALRVVPLDPARRVLSEHGSWAGTTAGLSM